MKRITLLLVCLALPHFVWAQLEFRAVLSGAQEVPSRSTSGHGLAWATLDTTSNLFTFDYTFADLLEPAVAAHIHSAPIGVNGGVIYPLPIVGDLHFSATLTETDLMQLTSGLWYVNVHTSVYPGGEIRGQLLPVPETSTYAIAAAALLLASIMVKQRASIRRKLG